MNLSDQLRELLKGIFDKIFSNQAIIELFVSLAMILFWVLLASVTIKIARFFLLRTKRLTKKFDDKETKQQLTIKRLINNIIKALYIFWIVIMILAELGLDIMPLLAGAGVLAFAVGFGAQELIKDVISGFFLIIERTCSIGDYVSINGVEGTITDVGIRRIKIETWKGEVITMNNGDIRTVNNYSINPSVAVIEIKVDLKFDFSLFDTIEFKDFLANFGEDNEFVNEMPLRPAMINVNDGMVFRFAIKTETRKNPAVEQAFRRELIKYFQDKGISLDIPLAIRVKNNDE